MASPVTSSPDSVLPSSKKDPLPSQIDLVTTILKRLGHRTVTPRHIAAITAAANSILAALKAPIGIAAPGGGYRAWRESDDTGMSSLYLAAALNGTAGLDQFNYPYDAGDFGRCYRMLRACPELAAKLPLMAQLPAPWPRLYESWSELERLYAEEEPSGHAPKLRQRLVDIRKASGVN